MAEAYFRSHFIVRETRRWSALLSIALVFTAVSRAGPSNEVFLDATVDRLEVGRGVDDLWTLCPKINRPCGLESLPRDRPSQNIRTVVLRNTTPRRVLNRIVRRHSAYHWTFRGGVINIEPKGRHGDDVLGRRLARVSIHGVSSLKASLDVLHFANLRFGYHLPSGDRYYARVNVELQDVTVRDALNAIAQADGELIWIFALSREGGEKVGTFMLYSWREKGVPFSMEEMEDVRSWKLWQ